MKKKFILKILGSKSVVKSGFILIIILTITSIWWNPPLTKWMIANPILGDITYFCAAVLAFLLMWGPVYVRYGVLQKSD